VASHSDLIDDAHSLLAALYRGPSAAAPCPTHCLHAPPLLPESCPFFLIGSSMGGAVALVLANMCCSNVPHASLHRYSSACCGVILAAPAIRIKLPWFAPAFILSPLKAVLRWLVLPLSPSSVLPGSFKKASASEHPIWDTEEYIAYVDSDPATYHGDLHLTTLCSIIDLSDAALDAVSALEHHSLRVLAFMDPADAVTDFAGVQALCSAAADGRVTVVEMPGAKHDVLSNRADAVLQRITAWLAPDACHPVTQAAGAAPQ
jgi:alpha-beta hydrolase superfamily lysophospholipase